MRHMEVPRLGVELELQLLVYTTAAATWDLSHVCKLHCSLLQGQMVSALSEDWNQPHILMDTSLVH